MITAAIMGKTSFARAGLHRTFGLSTLTTVDSLECNIQTIGLPCPLQQPPYVLQAPLPEVSSGMHRGAGVLYGNQALLSRVNPGHAVSSEIPNEKVDNKTDFLIFFPLEKNSGYYIVNFQLCSDFTGSIYQLSNF